MIIDSTNEKWPEEDIIYSPNDLKKWIEKLRRASELGKIRQYWPDNNPFLTERSISEIDVHGPWPDHIEWYFYDLETNHYYNLTCETYHGTGGYWKLIANG